MVQSSGKQGQLCGASEQGWRVDRWAGVQKERRTHRGSHQVVLKPGTEEASPCRSLAYQCMSWTRAAQGCAQDRDQVASSPDGQHHGALGYIDMS